MPLHPKLLNFVDWFIPPAIRRSDTDLLMGRTFVTLHLLGPVMGHAVTYFLASTPAGDAWQFLVVEALVASFLVVPLLLRWVGSLRLPAMLSVQMLVLLSLFGSFFFGGISSPFLPWFLIAMVLGFFYLADHARQVLVGVAIQLACFFSARAVLGDFPVLLEAQNLQVASLLSITAALAYMTLLCLYYEKVMRISTEMESEAAEQRDKLSALRGAMEAAELASRSKSIFLAKMSHELRTPLNAVIGYTEILRENYEDRADCARKTADLDRIRTAGRHLLALVDDVIDLSSIEADRLELTVEPVLVSSLIEEVVSTATPLIRKRDNRLIVRAGEDLGTLELDALKLRQCMLNLLSNAAKFTTKGTIFLSVSRDLTSAGEVLNMQVSDNGIGMTREGVSRLFDKFSQAETDTSAHFGGTGLGLALTRRFCKMMGGDIVVTSERGVGSTFSMTIPIVVTARARAQQIAA